MDQLCSSLIIQRPYLADELDLISKNEIWIYGEEMKGRVEVLALPK